MRLTGYAFGGLSAAYAGFYTVLYLTRWEWQRALISAVLLVIVEILLATVLLLARFSRLDHRLNEAEARTKEVRGRLEQTRQTRTPTGNRFAWLPSADPGEASGVQRTFVFVPVLMVAGAVLSGLAMVIQKVAGATVRAGAERRLAGRLTALTAPPVDDVVPLEDQPAVAPSRPGRRALTVTAVLASLPLALLLWSALADATQTRPERTPDASSTTVVFTVATYGEQSSEVVRLAANDLWETCRRSTAARNDKAGLQRMDEDLFAGVVSPALPSHDLMRLRGCLEDANTHRTTAVVLD
ncbi:hypothetical protein C4B68_08175 [Streptomyces dengpaensis]|uniref:TIGR04222 domain-containing membrane protein n=1 Tax=Streptomyces dengpaensis TaxID=2049881 RepID=A0ABM6T1P8_9ACTN|nr:hypothetical protein C4B68_08175 [Streptomyces dengpaensis]PIB12309.1 hypothetical protein B1C81_02115 [Streptomyces sp. HG99]